MSDDDFVPLDIKIHASRKLLESPDWKEALIREVSDQIRAYPKLGTNLIEYRSPVKPADPSKAGE